MPASVRAIANGFGTPSHNLALVLVVLVAAGALAFVLKIGWLYLVVFVLMLVWYVLTTRPTAQPGRSIEATLVAADSDEAGHRFRTKAAIVSD